MKIAFCIHGKSGLTNDKKLAVDSDLGYQYMKKYILDENPEHDIDVFFHSWSTNDKIEARVVNDWKPVAHVIEPQIKFDQHPFTDYHYPKQTGVYETQLKLHYTYSRFHSMWAANEFKKEYEKKYNFKYDIVMIVRFDLAWHTPLKFSELNVDKLYVTNSVQNETEMGWNDAWFIGNSETMDVFTDVYNHLDNYIEKDSDLAKFMNELGFGPDACISAHALIRWHSRQADLIPRVEYFLTENKEWHLVRQVADRKLNEE